MTKMNLTPRRELVQFLMKNSNIDKNNLCLLEDINLEDLIKKKVTCHSIESGGNLNVLCGTIRPRDLPKTNVYYSVKAFLSFETRSSTVPCFVAHDCLVGDDILNCKVVAHEWTFVWQEPRGGVDAHYLELNKILPMTGNDREKRGDSNEKQFSTLHVNECLELLSKLDLNTPSNELELFPVNVYGKVHSVSEIYQVFPEQWSLCFWLEDVEIPPKENERVLIKCDVGSFLWLHSMLKRGRSYLFTNLVARAVRMEDESVGCFAVTAETQVRYVDEEGPTADFMVFLSSDDAVKCLNISSSAKSLSEDNSAKKPKSWPRLETLTGTVTAADESAFGIMTLDGGIKVHMHGSGHGCFEHVRPGCEVVLENVRLSQRHAVGCQMSRLLVLRYPVRDLESVRVPRKVHRFASDDEGTKFYRIVSELVELCISTPDQLDSLLEQIGIPQEQFCPELVSAINYRTYSGFFAATVFKPSAGSNGNDDDVDLKQMEVTSVPLPPVKTFSSKLEQFISVGSGYCSEAVGQNRKIKFMTVGDLVSLGTSNGLFRCLDGVPDYWECKVMSSRDHPDSSVYVLGFLKSNETRGCVFLVDGKGSIECVVADSNPADDYLGHSCSDSDAGCRTHCQMSHAPCQLPTCPYLQPCHVDCLLRIDFFHLVSETFRSVVVDSRGRSAERSLERRYLVFSAAHVVSFGPHLLLEMGISSYPFWPQLEDVKCYIRDKFYEQPSDLTSFTLVPSEDLRMDENLMNRFGFETLVLKSYMEGNRDFSSAALRRYVNSDDAVEKQPDSPAEVCTCSLSLVFAVKHKEGLLARVVKPRDEERGFDPDDFLNEYFKRFNDKRPGLSSAGPRKRLRTDVGTSIAADRNGADEMLETDVNRPAPCAETSTGNGEEPGGDEHLQNVNQPLNEPCFDVLKPPKLGPDGKARQANFFRTKTIYEFGVEAFALDFADDVCQLCRSNKTCSKTTNTQFRTSECPLEVLLVFRDTSAGWYPVLRLGCVYTLEAKGTSCSELRQHLQQTTEALPAYLKNKSLTLSGWRYVIEVKNTEGVALNRHFRNWHLEAGNQQNLNRDGNAIDAAGVGRKVKMILDDLDRETRFQSDGRSASNAELETVIGVVVSKKFNSKSCSSEHDDPVKSERISNLGLSVPGSRKVVVTLRVLASDELVKVSTSENSIYKYPLGVLIGCCVCFRRVLKTDFTGQGRHSYRLYNFVPTSSLELVSFPSDLFKEVDVDCVKKFRFKSFSQRSRCDPETGLGGRLARPPESNDCPERCDDTPSGEPDLPEVGRGSIGDRLELLSSLINQLNRSGIVTEVPKRFYLRELLYLDKASLSRDPGPLNVFISRILWVSFSFSCPLHPGCDTGGKEQHLLNCPVCVRPLSKFKVKLNFEVCDSTSKAFVTCEEEELARKTLALPEKGWSELKQLVANCPSKSFYFDCKRTSYKMGRAAFECHLDDGLEGDLRLFLTTLADSNLVKRRVVVIAERFRTVLDQEGRKLPRLVHGPRPTGTASRPIAQSQFNVARRKIAEQLVESAASGDEGRSQNHSLAVQLELKGIDDIDVDAQCWAAQKRLGRQQK